MLGVPERALLVTTPPAIAAGGVTFVSTGGTFTVTLLADAGVRSATVSRTNVVDGTDN